MHTNCKRGLPSRPSIYDVTPPPDRYVPKRHWSFDDSLRTRRSRRPRAVDSATLRALNSLEIQIAETKQRIAAMRAKQNT